jgi:hypothetical protein
MQDDPDPGNLGSSDSDPFAFLGSPFAEYARLLVAADDAKKRHHAAQIAGNALQICRAKLECEAALDAVQAFKEHGAQAFLLCARFAAELKPGAVQALLDPAFRRELDVTQEAVKELEDRLDVAEDAVASLACGEAVLL